MARLSHELRAGFIDCREEMAELGITPQVSEATATSLCRPHLEEIAALAFREGSGEPHLAVLANEDGTFTVVCKSRPRRYEFDIRADGLYHPSSGR